MVPLAFRAGFGKRVVSDRLLATAAVCSVLPDIDVLAFHFGIPYASEFGHRGFTHSIFFAPAWHSCVPAPIGGLGCHCGQSPA